MQLSEIAIAAEALPKETHLEILVLYALPSDLISETIRSSLRAFEAFSRHNVHYVDAMLSGLAQLDLSRFDAVIVHYSIIVALPYRQDYLPDFDKLAAFEGVKAVFIQDDYRWVTATVDALVALKVDILFTCVSEDDYMRVYDDPRLAGVRIVSIFAGHVDQRLLGRKVPPYGQRRFDVGYRAQDLSGKLAWLGELAQEKKWIADRFLEDAGRQGLNVDISCDSSRRLHADDWFDFIADCRAVLGTESGASICDKTGEIQEAVARFITTHPDATFEQIRDACFPGRDFLTPVRSLSPRVFEAAALRTLMIFYPGNYGNILQPWRHYIPLEKDHSNIAEVVAALRDESMAADIIDRAYKEIACNPKYFESAVIQRLDQELASAMAARSWQPRASALSRSYSDFDFQLALCKRPRDELAAAIDRIELLCKRLKSEDHWKKHYRAKVNDLKARRMSKGRRSRFARLFEKLRLLLSKSHS
jgi:hypothetical protein